MKSIALYGGSFDPIHLGHLITASQAVSTYNLDKLIFIPSYITPLKEKGLSATEIDRFNMISLSIKNKERFEISDYEINKKGISYTYDTVKYFKSTYDIEKVYFIIGTDRAKDLKKWYNIEKLSKLVTFILVARDNENINFIVEDSFYKNINYKIMASPIIEISSSLIRNNIKKQKSVDYMIVEECQKYIEEMSLYEFSRNSN